jgi:5,10-methylenetetrahydromethanopterin reductase
MRVKFGLRLPGCVPVKELARQAAHAEEAGFGSIWIPDSPLLWRDPWIALSAAAMATSRVTIGVGVTTPVTRHLTVTACSACTLDELAGGRTILGVGQGDSSVRLIGEKPTTVAEMRSAIGTLRSLSAGNSLAIGGRTIRMKSAENRNRALPIYLAATGPKMLQLAGEIADGVLLLTGLDSRSIGYALANIRAGAERAGRQVEDLEIILGCYCYVGEDWRGARKLARPYAALFSMYMPDALRAVGIPVPVPQPMPGLYPDVNHCEDWERAVSLTAWVPDETLEMFCAKYTLMGTAREIIPRIESVAEHGITHVYLIGFQSYELPERIANVFSQEVIPYFDRDALMR